jgi:hypothetical protein
MGHATRENIMFGYQRGTRNDFSEMGNYRGGNGVDAVRSSFSFRSTLAINCHGTQHAQLLSPASHWQG